MKTWLNTFVLICAVSTVSYAQVAEFGVSGGQSRIKNKELGSGYSLGDGFRIAFRLTLNSWTFMGQEFGYAYNRSKLEFQQIGGITQNLGGMAIHQGHYNFLVYATPEGKAIRPFATGGGHFSNFVPPGASAAQGQGSTKFGVNYGAGVKAKLTERFQLRFDYRQFLTGKPFGEFFPVSGSLRQNEISVGLAYTL
jgi:opacity protein-like surface antigen